MAERQVAKEDIIETNELGQRVVVVPAGQPIPDGVKQGESKPAAAKAQEQPVENKARQRRGK